MYLFSHSRHTTKPKNHKVNYTHFSCIVVHEPKSAQLPYFEKVRLKEKSRAKNLFTKVIRAVSESLFMQKNWSLVSI